MDAEQRKMLLQLLAEEEAERHDEGADNAARRRSPALQD
jgi:hypothetical protein